MLCCGLSLCTYADNTVRACVMLGVAPPQMRPYLCGDDHGAERPDAAAPARRQHVEERRRLLLLLLLLLLRRRRRRRRRRFRPPRRRLVEHCQRPTVSSRSSTLPPPLGVATHQWGRDPPRLSLLRPLFNCVSHRDHFLLWGRNPPVGS